MNEPLTAAGAALVAEVHGTTMALVVFPARIRAIEAEAAARAVDEALSVERVAEVIREAWKSKPPLDSRQLAECIRAALVAHLRGEK